MIDESLDPETAARATLSLLETRLRRLEYLLTGTSDVQGVPTEHVDNEVSSKQGDTVSARLKKLQSDLDNLRKIHTPAGDLVKDVETLHTRIPELFTTSTTEQQPSNLSTHSSIVLSYATLYPEAASRLSSLQTLQIPSVDQSAKLIDLRPRLDAALRRQENLENEARDLRDRSARCLEWWVKMGVVGLGELWEDWESRVTEVDRAVKRIERQKASVEGYV